MKAEKEAARARAKAAANPADEKLKQVVKAAKVAEKEAIDKLAAETPEFARLAKAKEALDTKAMQI